MGEEALVESQISDTISLVKILESQGDKPSTVIWYYFPDADEWRLLLAGPSFDALLPNQESSAYQKVAEALSKAEVTSLTIGEVKLIKTDYPLLNATRFLIGTPPDAIIRAHFKDNRVNGIFIKEMLVLRSS
ncbi:MAG TPA: hypothetical protein VF397_17830 [Pyrinomonadaceae bacterium]